MSEDTEVKLLNYIKATIGQKKCSNIRYFKKNN